jgi:hypothetical protein
MFREGLMGMLWSDAAVPRSIRTSGEKKERKKLLRDEKHGELYPWKSRIFIRIANTVITCCNVNFEMNFSWKCAEGM